MGLGDARKCKDVHHVSWYVVAYQNCLGWCLLGTKIHRVNIKINCMVHVMHDHGLGSHFKIDHNNLRSNQKPSHFGQPECIHDAHVHQSGDLSVILSFNALEQLNGFCFVVELLQSFSNSNHIPSYSTR